MKRLDDFSLRDLYAALEVQCQARGLSWAAALREMTPTEQSGPQLSPSTLKGVGTRTAADGACVLQMLRWLNRPPERFTPGYNEADEASLRLPEAPPNKVLRFDTKRMYSAINSRRAERNLTWGPVAAEIGWSPAGLTRLAKGGRTWFPLVMRIVRWLGEPAARFVRISDH